VDILKIEIKFLDGNPDDRDKIYRWTPGT